MAELKRPFDNFFHRQASGGIVLLLATILALVLANSPISDSYFHFWEMTLSLGAGSWGFSQSLHHWINDGLMAIFFFVVGLELKREFLAGELATARKAALPAFAAFGGMVAPALIYYLLVPELPEAKGWGVPPCCWSRLVAPGVGRTLRGEAKNWMFDTREFFYWGKRVGKPSRMKGVRQAKYAGWNTPVFSR